jgi:AsmA protein
MKPLRIVTFVILGVVALVALALAAVLLFVDPNDYRATIEQRVAAATGRPLRIEGRLGLHVFPWIAVDVGRVSLGNAPGFGGAPFLQAESVRVGAKLVPLLRGRLEARRIAVDGLQVNLATRADGTTNWQDLTNRPDASSSKGGGGLREISIAGLDVTRAALTLSNAADRSTTRLRDFELRSGALRPGAETDLQMRGVLDAGDGTAATTFDVRTRATVDAARSALALRDLVVEGERRAATGAGTATTASAASAPPVSPPTRYRVASASLDYAWSSGTLSPTTVDTRWGDLPVQLAVQGEKLTGDRVVTGRVTVPEFSPRTVAGAMGIRLPATRDAQSFTKATLRGDFRLTTNAVQVSSLDATFDRSHLRGSAGLSDLKRAALAFDLQVDTLDVDAYRAPLPVGTGAKNAGTEAGSAAAAKAAPTAIPFDLLRSLEIDGKLAVSRLAIAGLTLGEVQLPITAHDGRLVLAPRATFYGGSLGGAGLSLDAQRSPATLDVAFDARGIDVAALEKAYAKSDRLSGHANARVRLRGTGTTDAALIDALAGPISFDVKDGALEGVDLVYELQRARALFRREDAPTRTGPQRTPFDTLTGESTLERGVLTTDPLRLETALLSVAGKGTFRLADQAVNYQLTTTVRDAPRPGADAAALADLRSISIPLSITGTVRDYRVRPDVGGLAKARVKQEVDKRRDEVTQKAKDKLKERLDKLLGR